MSSTAPRQDYYVPPPVLEHIVDTFTEESAESGALLSFADRCRRVGRLIAETVEVHGAENIPAEGPIIVVKTHPCHYDGLLLEEVFRRRPDVRLLAKPSPLMLRLPSENIQLLHKTGSHGDPEDIKALQVYLRDGGSLLATPWGALDHQGQVTSPERAAQNVVRFASFANATVVPAYIDAEWGAGGSLPLAHARITFGEPIVGTPDGPDAERITAAITDMYHRYTSQPSAEATPA